VLINEYDDDDDDNDDDDDDDDDDVHERKNGRVKFY